MAKTRSLYLTGIESVPDRDGRTDRRTDRIPIATLVIRAVSSTCGTAVARKNHRQTDETKQFEESGDT